MRIYEKILLSTNQLFAVLIDPDRINISNFEKVLNYGQQGKFDLIFLGGSLVYNSTRELIKKIKQKTNIPVVLFPGNPSQFTDLADALLFLSLLSGRNAEYLIGHHVTSAKIIKKSGIETIPTGYILIENNKISTTEYITNTKPIPSNKPELAVATALAGELLGMKMIYVEGGSGAEELLIPMIVKSIKKEVDLPVIAGGGIKNIEDLRFTLNSGADVIVIGTAIEENADLIPKFWNLFKQKI